MARIFISYSSKNRDKVAPLAAALEDYGHEVWWDKHLIVGDDYREQIDVYLSNAHAVVVVVTEETLESAWVRAEAEVGFRNGNLVPVRFSRGLKLFPGMERLHIDFLGDWDGKPRSEPIAKLVKRINDLKSERDRKDIMDTMPLGGRVRDSNFARAIFDLSLQGGLRVRTLMVGSLVGALPLWCGLRLASMSMTEVTIGADAYLLVVVMLLIARFLDQCLVVSKGGCSDRFFDRSFSFSLVACILAGVISAVCAGLKERLLNGASPDLGRMGLTTLALSLLFLLAGYAVRALILAGRVLHQRI